MFLTDFTSAHEITLVVAPVVGAYLCLSGMGLLRKGEADNFLSNLSAHPAAMHAVGAIAFFVGAGILTLHRHWRSPPEIVLDLVGAWWAFEGAGMLADPARLRNVISAPNAAISMKVAQLLGLPIGVYLLVVGLIGTAA